MSGGERSLFERMEALHAEIAGLVEDMGATVYSAIEAETLKRVAIAAGVDHTREGTVVIESIGAELQRQRDVVRELRRCIAALERRLAAPRAPLPPSEERGVWLSGAVDAVMTHWLAGMDPSNGDEATEALADWWTTDGADAALELVHVVVQAIGDAGYVIAPAAS